MNRRVEDRIPAARLSLFFRTSPAPEDSFRSLH